MMIGRQAFPLTISVVPFQGTLVSFRGCISPSSIQEKEHEAMNSLPSFGFSMIYTVIVTDIRRVSQAQIRKIYYGGQVKPELVGCICCWNPGRKNV